MRRNLTVSLDQGFIERMDALRGSMPRSRWLEDAIEGHRPPTTIPSSVGFPPAFVGPETSVIEPDAPRFNKWGDPEGTVYEETDPRSWT